MVETTGRPELGSAYWRLWTASAISNLGDGVDTVALPLLAASLTRDPRLVAGLTTAAFLPWLLFALLAGAIVDRIDRRRLMVAVNVMRAALVGVIAITAATDTASIWVLYVIAFLLGSNETLFDNAAQSIVPSVVDPDLLETANGRQYAAEIVCNSFAGPPLGGVLFSFAVAAPFALDSVSFVVSAALIATLTGSFKPTPDTAEDRPSFRADIAEGVRWLRAHHLLRTLALLLGVMNLCSNMGYATFVLFAEDILGLSARGFGVLLASMAVGAVLGGVFGSRLARALGPARALVLAAGIGGLAQIAVGLVSDAWIVALLGWIEGLLGTVWNVITVSLRQRIIPDHLLGRVNSVYRFLGWGSIPIGALLGGLFAHAFGLRSPFIIGGAVQIGALVLALRTITPSAIAAAQSDAPRA